MYNRIQIRSFCRYDVKKEKNERTISSTTLPFLGRALTSQAILLFLLYFLFFLLSLFLRKLTLIIGTLGMQFRFHLSLCFFPSI